MAQIKRLISCDRRVDHEISANHIELQNDVTVDVPCVYLSTTLWSAEEGVKLIGIVRN